MADNLIRVTCKVYLQLLTPLGVETWEARGAVSIINLAFGSANMARHLISCKKDNRLESGLDHYPITTLLALELPPQSQQQRQQRRNWKKMDQDGVAAGAEHLP